MTRAVAAPERWRPSGGAWSVIDIDKDWTVWRNSEGVFALSSVCIVDNGYLPPHWEWLISFSMMGRYRPSNKMMKKVLEEWGLEDFEEDNHGCGVARKYWMARDEEYRQPCPCKDEEMITEGDYQYSRKRR
ncbi:MAG: hypothetical protein CMF31_05260 [Kordiimonas sp.]|nr:hypothetical protein [Kordiimonas sp.]|tara:strand:- start:452 stop:844 length:393 start_codon:yes stop_codon:yes gene_type:complete